MGLFSWFFRHKADKARRDASTECLKQASEEVKLAVRRTNVITARNTIMFDDAREAAEQTIRRLENNREDKEPE